MDDDSAASKLGTHGGRRVRGQQVDNISKKTGGGTSRQYLVSRLERAGRTDLLDGIAQGQISVFAAAAEAGIVRRRKTVADGDHNATRRREFAMAAVLERAPPTPYVCAEVPCFGCRHLNTNAALREIADGYLARQRGEPSRGPSSGGLLPASCCRRQRVASIDALIG
jgi:hypothetical protein